MKPFQPKRYLDPHDTRNVLAFERWTRKRDAEREALAYLDTRDRLRLTRARMLARAYAALGDTPPGSLIAGIESCAFPLPTQIALRQNARQITKCHDRSTELWRRAGRRLATWRRENERRVRPTVGGRVSRY